MKRKDFAIGCLIETAIAFVSVGAGAVHGYCDEKKIPFQKENMQYALTYGPAIITAGIGGIEGLARGFIRGGAEGVESGLKDGLVEEVSRSGAEGVESGLKKGALKGFAKGLAGAFVGCVSNAVIRGTLRGAEGGIETLVGYAIGRYVIGQLV